MSDHVQIRGKVADIEDRYVLVINKGSADGVQIGTIFGIMDPDGAPVIDPDSGEELGRREVEKLRVKVIDVYPRFCRASTYRMVSPLMGSIGASRSLRNITDSLGGREHIVNQRVSEAQDSATQAAVTVNIGDSVRQIGEA